MNLLELHPAPHEVTLARVPAGMTLRVHRGGEGPLRDPLELAASGDLRYVEVPGSWVPWGAVWSTWFGPAGVARNRHPRDRDVWKQAARMLARRLLHDGTPAGLYVVHEQREEHGKPVWVAVGIRESLTEAEREQVAMDRHKCPRCRLPRLNRCRDEDGTILERPHPERVKLVAEADR